MFELIKITYSEGECSCRRDRYTETVARFTTKALAQAYELQSRNYPPVVTDLDRRYGFWRQMHRKYRMDSLLCGAADYEINDAPEAPVDPAPPAQDVARIAYFDSEPYYPDLPKEDDYGTLIAVLTSGERVRSSGQMTMRHKGVETMNRQFGLSPPVKNTTLR